MVLDTARTSSGPAAIPMMIPSVETSAGDRASGDDAALVTFIRSLLPPDEASDVLRGVYTMPFHARLMERLGRIRHAAGGNAGSGQAAALQPWRLTRVKSFVDQNIDAKLPLDCLARVAGLSRMHFAALFRKATGLRPHDYVIRRRIEVSQLLLAKSQTPIVEIALSVGFQSQSHFTTVFKRMVGITPHIWRQMRHDETQRAERSGDDVGCQSRLMPPGASAIQNEGASK